MDNISYRCIKITGISFIIGVLSFIPFIGYAQVSGIEALMKAGKEDATALTREYFRPLSSGLGAAVNSGWQHSAKPNEIAGINIQARAALALIPAEVESFDIADLNLQTIVPADPGNTVTPTLSGNDQTGPQVIVQDDGEEVARFNLPPGTGTNIIPAPELQASLGILQDTDLIVRFVPRISLGDFGSYNQYGIGGKHRINSTLPNNEMIPVDISLLAGYNRINISSSLDVDREPGSTPDPTYLGSYDNQEVDVVFHTFNVKALVGKSTTFFTVYGGLGYEYSNMNVDVTGDYPVPVRGPLGGTGTRTVSDPVSYSQTGDNGISGLAGVKFQLGLISVFADYTHAKYPVVNTGIGFSLK